MKHCPRWHKGPTAKMGPIATQPSGSHMSYIFYPKLLHVLIYLDSFVLYTLIRGSPLSPGRPIFTRVKCFEKVSSKIHSHEAQTSNLYSTEKQSLTTELQTHLCSLALSCIYFICAEQRHMIKCNKETLKWRGQFVPRPPWTNKHKWALQLSYAPMFLLYINSFIQCSNKKALKEKENN